MRIQNTKLNFKFELIAPQEGKTAIVTGASAGIGLETTRYLALKGATVVMACHNDYKANEAKRAILREVPYAKLDVMNLDLSVLANVRRFCAKFRANYPDLNLLINNAGIMWVPYYQTEDGFEDHMATNYFGHFLLTNLLLPAMPDDLSSRIVTLSSLAHRRGQSIRFDDLHWTQTYNKYHAYAHSKLADLMFALQLHKWLERSGKSIRSIAAHPGLTRTELVRTLSPWKKVLYHRFFEPFFTQPAHRGALPVLAAALAPDVKGGSYLGPFGMGEMFGPPTYAKVHPSASNEAAALQLWQVSEALTGCEYPFALRQ